VQTHDNKGITFTVWDLKSLIIVTVKE